MTALAGVEGVSWWPLPPAEHLFSQISSGISRWDYVLKGWGYSFGTIFVENRNSRSVLQSPAGWGVSGAGGGRDVDTSAVRRNKSAVAVRAAPADRTPTHQQRSKSYHRISSTPIEILPSRASPPPQRGSPVSRGLGFGLGPEYGGGSATTSPSISPQRQRPR